MISIGDEGMKKYIREGIGEEIEEFLEWFLSQNELYKAESSNKCIKAWRLNNDIVRLELKIKLGS